MKNSYQRKIFNILVFVINLLKPIIYLSLLRGIIGLLLSQNFGFQFENEDVRDKFLDFLSLTVFLLILFRKNIHKIKELKINIAFNKYSHFFFFGFLLALIMSTVIYVSSKIVILSNIFNIYEKSISESMTGTNAILVLMNVVILSPIFEEYVFRYHVMNILNVKFGEKIAILITSLLFAILHGFSIIWIFLAFIFSVLICIIHIKYSLVNCFFFHIGFNSVNLLFYIINNNYWLNYFVVEHRLIVYLLLFIISLTIIFYKYKQTFNTIFKYIQNQS